MVIWWVRRDLRLADNPALHAALSRHEPLIPLFILDPHILRLPAGKRHSFLFAGLRQLDRDLRARGSRLVVREGSPQEVLAALVAQAGVSAIFAEEGYSPYARQRDAAVGARLPLHLTPGLTVHHPTTVVKSDGSPYTVFTPFMRVWKARPLPTERTILPTPTALPPVPDAILSAELPEANPPDGFAPGEKEACRRLEAFTHGTHAPIYDYDDGRNHLDREGTSQLSPYLRFGMLSARQAVVAAQAAYSAAQGRSASKGSETWLNELVWREFYQAILYHFPNVLQEAFRPTLRAIPWNNDTEDFTAWCDGRTGFPVVDAAMRQLAVTGWMHNRARMIVASFLVKDLLIDWHWGERWFMEHLVDGEPAANNGGWQWTAGVGSDAAPYFRVFNPIVQARRFDPAGEFVRRWLPALAAVPDTYIHAPWTMPADVQRAAHCVIGEDYPAPIVDRALVRQRALAAYRAARGNTNV